MKAREVQAMSEFLGSLKINKIENPDLRYDLFIDFVKLNKIASKITDDINNLREKCFEDKKESVDIYVKTTSKIKQETDLNKKQELIDSLDPDTVKLVSDFMKASEDILNKDIDLEINTVSREDFLKEVDKQDISLTFADVLFLSPLFDS